MTEERMPEERLMKTTDPAIPPAAAKLIRDAEAAGNNVTTKLHPATEKTWARYSVEIEIVAGLQRESWESPYYDFERVTAVWVQRPEGWRYLYGTDGWVEDMSLNTIRSFGT